MLAIDTKPSGLHCSYWWCLNDSNGFNNLLLVCFRTGSVKIADDRSHTSLVAQGGSEVDRLLGVIFGEGYEGEKLASTFSDRGR